MLMIILLILLLESYSFGTQVWDEVCQSIIKKMAQQQYRQALLDGVIQIGVILDRFYANKIQDQNDELENAPIMLN